MAEAESQSGPKFCRQCGKVVPEGTAICPACGKRWYMDRVEEQGVSLWQRIIEKRSASGMGDSVSGQEQRQYRCPNCMAVLPSALPKCPHCGKSTQKPKIYPQAQDQPGGSGPEGEKRGEPARGQAGAKIGRRSSAIGVKRLKKLDVIIIAAIVVIIVGLCGLLAYQSGLFRSLFTVPKAPSQSATPTAMPAVANIAVSEVTATGASIAWTTDLAAYGKVLYGKADLYGLASQADNRTASHRVLLSGLEPATAYHFAVLAMDKDGKELSRSMDQTFSTLARSNTQPPVVSQFTVLPSDISAVVTWATDKPATAQVLYGLDQSTSGSTSVDSRLITQHSIRVSGLQPGQTYYYRIKSVDADGNQAIMEPPDSFVTYVSVPLGSKIGDRAPDFTLPLVNSQESISLRTYKGQKILLSFWAVYCPECDRELELLQTVRNRNPQGVAVIGVFLESKPEEINKAISAYKSRLGDPTFAICLDAYKTTAHLYNVEKVPCTFFIDGENIIRAVEFGNFNIDQVQQILNDL